MKKQGKIMTKQESYHKVGQNNYKVGQVLQRRAKITMQGTTSQTFVHVN